LAARLKVAIDKWVSDITYNTRSVNNFTLFKAKNTLAPAHQEYRYR
jgi:hypothetical protein